MADSLIQLARSNPKDKQIARRLFLDYEATKEHDHNYDLTYLKLKWFHGDVKWKYLNEIANSYISIGKNRIAFMCLVASLVANPRQPLILELAQSLRERSRPKVPDNLRENKFTASVIMATCNRGAEIRESIQSVLNQSFRDFELVVVNDGGTDAVKEIVDSFRSDKIKYCRLDRNRGLAAALNEGILRAEGKYMGYLDDDDIYYPNHLSTLIGFIEGGCNYDLVYSNAWWCSGEIKGDVFVQRSRKLLDRRPNRFDRELLFRGNYISTLNLLHRKDCFKKCGLFNDDLAMLMDWELWMRFAMDYNYYQINDITGEYRFKGNNMSIIDELSMIFLAKVVRLFYETDCGNIVFLKHYLRNDEREKAEEVYESMLSNYSRYSLTVKKELFYISNSFSYWKRRGLFKEFAVDYLKYKARHLAVSSFKREK